MTVRKAGVKDAGRIAPLFDGYRQFYGQAPDLVLSEAFIRERLERNESVVFLAEEHGNALGFTQLYPAFSSIGARRIWILNDLFVTGAARGRGAGKALLDAARAHAVATGAIRLELATAHDNPAQKLYEAMGYRRDTGSLHYILDLA
jgi:GNAT superfamily N-acetyltransferase